MQSSMPSAWLAGFYAYCTVVSSFSHRQHAHLNTVHTMAYEFSEISISVSPERQIRKEMLSTFQCNSSSTNCSINIDADNLATTISFVPVHVNKFHNQRRWTTRLQWSKNTLANCYSTLYIGIYNSVYSVVYYHAHGLSVCVCVCVWVRACVRTSRNAREECCCRLRSIGCIFLKITPS